MFEAENLQLWELTDLIREDTKDNKRALALASRLKMDLLHNVLSIQLQDLLSLGKFSFKYVVKHLFCYKIMEVISKDYFSFPFVECAALFRELKSLEIKNFSILHMSQPD